VQKKKNRNETHDVKEDVARYDQGFFYATETANYTVVTAQTAAVRFKKNHGKRYHTEPTKPVLTVYRSVFIPRVEPTARTTVKITLDIYMIGE
jgi:hypothetical protein